MAHNIIVVHRPELSAEERARRMAVISEAAARLVYAANMKHTKEEKRK